MIKTISTKELKKMLDLKEEFKLIDVLDSEHYRKEHIPNAISLPLNELRKKAKNVLNKDEKIVVYCASFECEASTKAVKILQSLGYKNVLDYKGGLKDYRENGLALAGKLHETHFHALSCKNC